jgi:hypothetical protein
MTTTTWFPRQPPDSGKNDNFEISPINHANHANFIELISYNTAIYSVW